MTEMTVKEFQFDYKIGKNTERRKLFTCENPYKSILFFCWVQEINHQAGQKILLMQNVKNCLLVKPLNLSLRSNYGNGNNTRKRIQ